MSTLSKGLAQIALNKLFGAKSKDWINNVTPSKRDDVRRYILYEFADTDGANKDNIAHLKTILDFLATIK